MAITYDYYRIFYHVVQCHSFTKAAEVLENNQPNITRCMNNLEYELGCKLFVRSNRGVSLTPEGERLFRRVSVAYEQLTLGERELFRDCSLESGSISVAASETALHLILLEKMSCFHQQYPGVKLRITNDSTPAALASVLAGQVDCAVVTTPHRNHKGLRSTPLLPFRDILICGEQYRDLSLKTRSLRDLSELPFVYLGRETGTYELYQRFYFKHDLPFRVDMEAATMDQVLPMIRWNLGIGFCPEQMAAKAIEAGEVYRIPLEEPLPGRSVCLIEDEGRPQSVAMKAFRTLLRTK